jgi:hypothetical protein
MFQNQPFFNDLVAKV